MVVNSVWPTKPDSHTLLFKSNHLSGLQQDCSLSITKAAIPASYFERLNSPRPFYLSSLRLRLEAPDNFNCS